MKRIGWMALVPMAVWAQMSIATTERVSKELSPDVLHGSLTYEEQGRNAHAIKEHLNAIVAEVKRTDPQGRYCGGGGYHLSPRYQYANQKQEFVGYGGTLSLTCEFDTIERYNEMSAALDRITPNGVRKTQGALEWQVSAQKREVSQMELRTVLLHRVQTQAERFSHDTQLSCDAVSVRMGSIPAVMPMQLRAMAMMEGAPTESPIRSDETSLLEAAVEYACTKR